MPDSSQVQLDRLLELLHQIPLDPAAHVSLSQGKRALIRRRLEEAIQSLETLAQAVDSVRQPKLVFDPSNPKIIAETVARALLVQDKHPLGQAVETAFYGAGVYALYYRGPMECYAPISGIDHPIYVGKADPEEMHAETPQAQGTRLHSRLRDHHRSLQKATNLRIEDFECRYLVVRSAWVETAEDFLIDQFRPVWNNETKVCYGFGKHGDSSSTRKNERSPWDTLHPGRPWANDAGNTPNRLSISAILANIAKHFSNHPPIPSRG